MHTIHKYPASGSKRFTLRMPKGAQVLGVHLQYGDPQIWALVDPAADKEERYFRAYGTGHTVVEPESLTHIGTVLMHEGRLVVHYFEDDQTFELEQLR